jgi:hypothetical protein
MATAQQIAAPAGGQSQALPSESGNEVGNRQALVTVSPTEMEQEVAAFSAPVSLLPVELDVAVPVRGFRVRNLLNLQPGQLIESRWGNGEDVPLATGEVQLAWSEFEVIESLLAVRITRLA